MSTLPLIVPKAKNTNVYKLVVSNMSGDADAYHKTITMFTKDQEDVLKDIIDLCKWSNKAWPGRDEIQVKYNEIRKNHLDFFGGSDEEGEEDYYDDENPIVTMDVTSDGQYICRPEVSKLTWFESSQDGNLLMIKR